MISSISHYVLTKNNEHFNNGCFDKINILYTINLFVSFIAAQIAYKINKSVLWGIIGFLFSDTYLFIYFIINFIGWKPFYKLNPII
jgi:hypothetical protein